jgi:hypothetical protein
MRRHHEELILASSTLPMLSLLIPFSAALLARIASVHKASSHKDGGTRDSGQ